MNKQTHDAPQNTLPPAAMNLHREPNKAMQQMMETIDRLQDVYERETDALQKMDTNTFLELQQDKEKHALSYEAGIREIIARKDEMRDVDQSLKNKLHKMQTEFSELSVQNMRALKRMGRTIDRLNGTIREVAKTEANRMRSFSYGQNGRMQADKRKQISISVSEDV